MLGSGRRKSVARRLAAALLILIAAFTGILVPPASASSPLHGAGLVIRHGNGKIVYAYVEFTGKEISGAELLARSGLPVKISPVPGLGEEVCEIQQEGCPPSNCYCKSYASPAYYWHYYRLGSTGNWVYQQEGPTTSMVHDGEVDGWSWTADQPKLPKTSIEQIAKLNGVQRQAAPATPMADVARVSASPTTSPAQQATVTRTATPIAHAVEGSGGSDAFVPVKTSAKSSSSGPNTSTLAEIAIALAVLAAAAGWITLRRRRRVS